MSRLPLLFMTAAASCLVVGVAMGIGMGIAHDFQLAPVHAHTNLVGWASLSLMGLTLRAWPQLAEGRLAVAQFVLSAGSALAFPPGIYLAIFHGTAGLAIVAGMVWLLGTPELARFVEKETLPGPQAQSDDELLDFSRRNSSTTYHLIGTARMGPETDPTAVVSDRLLVHGMQGLRVVDASIMPSMPSANTYATTMMIAEKAADFIRGRHAEEEAA